MEIKISTIRNFFIGVIVVFVSACQEISSVDNLPENQDPFDPPKITHTEPSKPTISVFGSTPESAADEISLLEVLKTRIVKNDPGAYRVIGLVRNNTKQSVTNIKVKIQVFDSSNNLRISSTTQTPIISLPPDEISPFVLWTNEILPSDVYAIGSVIDYIETEFQQVEVVVRKELITLDDRNDVHVTGEFYNNNLFPILIHGMAAATLDLDGNLLTADSQSVFSNYLEPGEASPFRVTMPGPVEVRPAIGDHMVFIDARVASPEDYIDIAINKNLSPFIDQLGIFHLVGEISNNSDHALNIGLIAALYDSNGNIIDASTTRLPLNSIFPGKTLPFDFNLWGPLSSKDGSMDSAERYSVQWDPFWTWSSDVNYAPLTITEEAHQTNLKNGIFAGAVANLTGSQVSSATVIVSIYDENNGKLLAMNAHEIIEEISVGSSIDYEVNLGFANGIIDFELADIRIIAFGKIP